MTFRVMMMCLLCCWKLKVKTQQHCRKHRNFQGSEGHVNVMMVWKNIKKNMYVLKIYLYYCHSVLHSFQHIWQDFKANIKILWQLYCCNAVSLIFYCMWTCSTAFKLFSACLNWYVHIIIFSVVPYHALKN